MLDRLKHIKGKVLFWCMPGNRLVIASIVVVIAMFTMAIGYLVFKGDILRFILFSGLGVMNIWTGRRLYKSVLALEASKLAVAQHIGKFDEIEQQIKQFVEDKDHEHEKI